MSKNTGSPDKDKSEPDLKERLTAAVSYHIECMTKSSHHHATRKSMVKNIVSSIMEELATIGAIPFAPDVTQKLLYTTARLAGDQKNQAIWQDHVVAVMKAAELLDHSRKDSSK